MTHGPPPTESASMIPGLFGVRGALSSELL